MTTEKLTAKLSDGTEWELVQRYWNEVEKEDRMLLRPLKPEPPKEVFIRVYSDNSVSATYCTAKEAVECTRGYSGPSNIHRYTLAPEPEGGSAPKCIFCEKPMDLISQVGSARNYSCLPCINARVKKAQDKKPAREWWDIRSRANGDICATRSSEKQAEEYLKGFNLFERQAYEIVHVREVV